MSTSVLTDPVETVVVAIIITAATHVRAKLAGTGPTVNMVKLLFFGMF
jgi:hypothetical protein